MSALAWATTIVVATWPLMLSVERRVGGRRTVATTVMTGGCSRGASARSAASARWCWPVRLLKPVLIRRGVDLPLPLIIGGVIGGLLGFGVVGLFLGPIVLAVTYTLFQAWVRDEDQPAGH